MLIKKNNFYYLYFLFFVFPIFININGIYSDKIINVTNDLLLKPIPINFYVISLFSLFYLIKNFRDPFIYKFILINTILFILAISQSFIQSWELNKWILFFQCILPYLGLIVGFYFFNFLKIKFFLNFNFYFLFFFMLFQIALTLISGYIVLRANLVFFTIYQNIQYVSSVLVFLTIFSIFLGNFYFSKKKILILFLISFIYSLMSTNLSTIGIWIFGFIFYFFIFDKKKLIILPIIYICLLIFSNISLDYKKTEYQHDWSFRFEQLNKILTFQTPTNISERFKIYNNFFEQKHSLKSIFFGDKNIDLIEKHGSSHNIFIDYYYLFGLVPVILIVYLLAKYFILSISKGKFCFSIYSVFISYIFFENFFKVALRQPYSGIMSFFIFGLIIKILVSKKNNLKTITIQNLRNI